MPPPTERPLAAGSKRARPDYDGRPELPEGDGAAIWTARILLSPAWLVTEVLIREPARGAFWVAEEVKLIGGVADRATQDPDDAVGLTPTLVIEAGEHPMIGAYGQIEHLMAPWERLRAVASIGGVDVMRAHVVDEMRLGSGAHLVLGVAGLRRDDLVTWGEGPRSDERDAHDWEVALLAGEARLRVELAPRDLASISAWMEGRRADLEREGGPLPLGPGETTTLKTGTAFRVDAPPPSGGGTSMGGELDIRAEHAAVVDGPREGSFIAWGARGGVAVDLTGTRRVLSLGAQIDGLDPISRDVAIPLLDLPGAQRLDSDLEGDLLLGARPGRMVGRRLVEAAIDYRWPIWTVIDAQLQAGVGNAFGASFRDVEPGLLRFAFAGGLIAPIRDDFAVRALVGFSTETFDDGTEPALARVLVGAGTDL